MKDSIDDKIRALEKLHYKNWQRIAFNLRKHLDSWSHVQVKPSWADMKLSYWPVICNIGIDGSTVSELARRSMMPKQNISRTVKELEKLGMIVSCQNANDKRSDMLILTDNGKKLILEVNTDVLKINDVYSSFIDDKELDIAISVLNRILDYHDSFIDNNTNIR